jgi:hypothetical protein
MTDNDAQNPQTHLELVGRISASWAVLELNFEGQIGVLVGGDLTALMCVTSQFSSYYPKLKAVIALCKYRGLSRERVKDLEKFLGSLSELAERRNRVIHDAWLVKGGKIIGKVGLDEIRPPSPSTVEELEALRDAINKRIFAFGEISRAILAELVALRKKHP